MRSIYLSQDPLQTTLLDHHLLHPRAPSRTPLPGVQAGEDAVCSLHEEMGEDGVSVVRVDEAGAVDEDGVVGGNCFGWLINVMRLVRLLEGNRQ